jgi:hypothetical protein
MFTNFLYGISQIAVIRVKFLGHRLRYPCRRHRALATEAAAFSHGRASVG